VLLHDYAFVDAPADRIRERIAADHGEWLSGLAVGAAREGESLRLRVGPIGSLPMLSKIVTIHADPPITRGQVTVVPLTWRATGSQGIFPALNADLEVAPLSPESTQLTLRGHYVPPLGAVGERLDRLLLHRVAEATIRSFMRGLVVSLTANPHHANSAVPTTPDWDPRKALDHSRPREGRRQ
jgi:hypothetical protein